MTVKSLNLEHGEDVKRWNAFIATHGQPYLHTNWARVLKTAYNFQPVYLYQEEHGEIISVFPLCLVKKPWGRKELVSTPHIESGGMLNTGSYVSYLEYIHTHYRAETIRIYQPGEPLGDVVANTGEVIMVKELPGHPDELLPSIPATARKYIKGILKRNYSTTTGNDRELFSQFYELYLDKMREFGTPPHGMRFFDAIREAMDDACIIIIVKDQNNNCVGAALVVGHANVLNGLFLVVPTAALKQKAGNLIEYRVMEYAMANGYTSLVLGRCVKESGHYMHKARLNAKPVPLYLYKFVLTCNGYQGVAEKSAKEKFHVCAQIWSRLPTVITNHFGPPLRKWIY